MKRSVTAALVGVLACLFAFPVAGAAGDTPAEDRQEAIEQARKATEVFNEIMGISDEERTIPKELLDDAEVIAIFPNVVKAAFIFGGSGGKGVVSARDPKTGRWGPPAFLKVGGASWGAQIGAESADFILVGVNREAQQVFEKGEWKLGAEAGVAAGPVGRKAAAGTDWKLQSGLLSYSRSKGLFAGIALDGSKINVDEDLNRAVYGPSATMSHILAGHAEPQADAKAVMTVPQTLAKYGRPKPDR